MCFCFWPFIISMLLRRSRKSLVLKKIVLSITLVETRVQLFSSIVNEVEQ